MIFRSIFTKPPEEEHSLLTQDTCLSSPLAALKIATKLKCWDFFHSLCLSEQDLRFWGSSVCVGGGLTGE